MVNLHNLNAKEMYFFEIGINFMMQYVKGK